MATTSTAAKAAAKKTTGVQRTAAKSTAAKKAAVRKTAAPAKTSSVRRTTNTVAKAGASKAIKAAPAHKPISKTTAKPVTKKHAHAPAKVKLVRDNFSFPAAEYAVLVGLKKRSEKLGHSVKKSEILRAGIAHLHGLADAALLALLGKVERVKKSRPAKKGAKHHKK